ncbi:unnamed protein product [Leptidea sinapis]|uniref:Peptidase S1 domain-containing protein n=1 Tax=Leptidea sinapis TaxID=189913 RepID=A0A5E4QL35_9NEOP|nr:unnamed protein product [Leptidea sinapis]
MVVKHFLLLALTVAAVFSEELATYPENVRENQGRIVSGWEAYPGQFPYQLSLRMVSPAGVVFACGATVIHNEWALTAAHCTAARVTILIRAGATDLSNPELVLETTEYYNHPNYIEQLTSVQPDDIGLIKFPIAIEYSQRIQPIRLQSSQDRNKNYDRMRFTATGWGRTWTGEPVCVCGDSGGGLTVEDIDGQPTQVGVSSFVSSGGCHTEVPAAPETETTTVTQEDTTVTESETTVTEAVTTVTEAKTTVNEAATTVTDIETTIEYVIFQLKLKEVLVPLYSLGVLIFLKMLVPNPNFPEVRNPGRIMRIHHDAFSVSNNIAVVADWNNNNGTMLDTGTQFRPPRVDLMQFPKAQHTGDWLVIFRVIMPMYMVMTLSQFITYLLMLVTAGILGSFAVNLMSGLYFIQVFVSNADSLAFWFLSLISSSCYALAMDKALVLDMAGVGVTWDNLWSGPGVPFGGSLIMMAIDTVNTGSSRSHGSVCYHRSGVAVDVAEFLLYISTPTVILRITRTSNLCPSLTGIEAVFFIEKIYVLVDGEGTPGQRSHQDCGPPKNLSSLPDPNDMHEIRQMIGVCPQQDVLFDLLSVKEHLKFFAAIKSLVLWVCI